MKKNITVSVDIEAVVEVRGYGGNFSEICNEAFKQFIQNRQRGNAEAGANLLAKNSEAQAQLEEMNRLSETLFPLQKEFYAFQKKNPDRASQLLSNRRKNFPTYCNSMKENIRSMKWMVGESKKKVSPAPPSKEPIITRRTKLIQDMKKNEANKD